MGQGPYQPQWPPPVPYPPYGMSVWTCTACRFQGQTMVAEKVSTGGWIVFALLLLMCFPLCFLGLLIKDRFPVCPNCRARAF